MMIFSLVAMIGLEKCCITSACLQWLCHSGERIVARGPLVLGERTVARGPLVLGYDQICVQGAVAILIKIAWHLQICNSCFYQVSEPWPIGLLF